MKVIQLVKRETVNVETGQIVQSDTETIVRLPQEPEYIKLYLRDLSHILEVPAGPQSVLILLVRKLDYDGVITLGPASRTRIAESLGIKVHTLANYITVLCDKSILKRTARGEYEMNPHIMARGSWSDILKRRGDFKMTVTYRADGTKSVVGMVEAEEVI